MPDTRRECAGGTVGEQGGGLYRTTVGPHGEMLVGVSCVVEGYDESSGAPYDSVTYTECFAEVYNSSGSAEPTGECAEHPLFGSVSRYENGAYSVTMDERGATGSWDGGMSEWWCLYYDADSGEWTVHVRLFVVRDGWCVVVRGTVGVRHAVHTSMIPHPPAARALCRA